MTTMRRIPHITNKALKLCVLVMLIKCFGHDGAVQLLTSATLLRERLVWASRKLFQPILEKWKGQIIMTRKQLIAISAIRDALDFALIGQIPGLNWALNIPVIFLHYRFAGPRALITLCENIPGVEMLPSFTVAMLSYPSMVSFSEANTGLPSDAAKSPLSLPADE